MPKNQQKEEYDHDHELSSQARQRSAKNQPSRRLEWYYAQESQRFSALFIEQSFFYDEHKVPKEKLADSQVVTEQKTLRRK